MDVNDTIQNYCRICASNCPDKQNLFEVIYDEKRLINILEQCLKHTLDTGVYFPNCICSDCSVDLIKTYEFFVLFEKSEKWFTEHFSPPNITYIKCEHVDLPLAEGESENMLDISVKSEHENFVQGIEDVDIDESQNILEIKNEFFSDYECEGNELTGLILPFLSLAVMGMHNKCLEFS